jgi:hypothetical protein
MMGGHDIVYCGGEDSESAVEEVDNDDGAYRERCKLADSPHLFYGQSEVTFLRKSLRTIRRVILRCLQHAQLGVAARVELWQGNDAPDPSGSRKRLRQACLFVNCKIASR